MSTEPIRDEQKFITSLYARLDDLRDRAEAAVGEALRTPGTGSAQSRLERDILVAEQSGLLAAFNAGETGLCFGRLVFKDGRDHHIGRIGLREDDPRRTPLVVDWRAEIARPFYLATGHEPMGLTRRRHITTKGREVVSLHDEVLDLADRSRSGHEGRDADEVLLAALDAARTGRMHDIVQTIQAEQDAIIRSPHHGVLVVEGGPGTGKTAVALHRAAYLLYAHREQLAKRAVLIVGPNPAFLGYIGNVLPSLGETGVLLATPGELYPGVRATAPDIDLVIVRENSEGFYADRNMFAGSGEFRPTPDVAMAVGVVTRRACELIAHEAFRLASARRKKVTIVHKANVLPMTMGLFRDVCYEIAHAYPGVQAEDEHVDAMAAHLVRAPGDYDVVVTENLFGDILSDLAGELSGSLGMSPSLNCSATRAMAQAVHGAAPTLAGHNRANPVALQLSAAMLLNWLGTRDGDPALVHA
ncbi:isocitrate/isopropylmalate family dehydrogenase, partial [Streptomyces roseolus]|uniref:isocitrate/isopropylmalate family dehydrogenase n=1 Tax=Streptomyces roseolus TaxID=67358 RepID=UPI003660211F